MLEDYVTRYYDRAKVQQEIAKYCARRWVGVHCVKKDKSGRPLLIRYTRGTRQPLTISRPRDVPILVRSLKPLMPRAIYGTANIYRTLGHWEDVSEPSKVIACTPTWDIDNTLEDWQTTIAVAKEIVEFLNNNGVKNSLYVKWSGNGCHIHISEGAISPELTSKIHPLDLAYATVRYTILSLSKAIRKLCEKRMNKVLKVENNMDPQRLFTAPLSLHRSLDKACVCIQPSKLDRFTPEWLTPERFRHYSCWQRYVEGEADQLVKKAYNEVGPR